MEIIGETLDVILDALAEQLRSLGEQMEVVVIGGSALTALGLVKRATRDVDLLAIAENGELRPAEPLPEALRTARDRIARDFELDENWLNPGPTELLRWGLPTGFMTRVVTRHYGQALTVHFAGAWTRFTSSSLPWLIKLGDVTRRISGHFVRAPGNLWRRHAGL